jgi:hypothetical protein
MAVVMAVMCMIMVVMSVIMVMLVLVVMVMLVLGGSLQPGHLVLDRLHQLIDGNLPLGRAWIAR